MVWKCTQYGSPGEALRQFQYARWSSTDEAEFTPAYASRYVSTPRTAERGGDPERDRPNPIRRRGHHQVHLFTLEAGQIQALLCPIGVGVGFLQERDRVPTERLHRHCEMHWRIVANNPQPHVETSAVGHAHAVLHLPWRGCVQCSSLEVAAECWGDADI